MYNPETNYRTSCRLWTGNCVNVYTLAVCSASEIRFDVEVPFDEFVSTLSSVGISTTIAMNKSPFLYTYSMFVRVQINARRDFAKPDLTPPFLRGMMKFIDGWTCRVSWIFGWCNTCPYLEAYVCFDQLESWAISRQPISANLIDVNKPVMPCHTSLRACL